MGEICQRPRNKDSPQLTVHNNIIFKDMEEIEGDIFVGIGIKRMKGYKCNLKIDELNKKNKVMKKIGSLGKLFIEL